jgi:hypothetical protein
MRDPMMGVLNGLLPNAEDYPFAAPAVGEQVDENLIQVLDKDTAWKWLMALTFMGTQFGDFQYKDTVAPEHVQLSARAFRQPDGRLHYRIEFAGGDALGMRLVPSQWKLLTPEEFALAKMGGPYRPRQERH